MTDYRPYVSFDSHDAGTGAACIMEIVALLNGEEQTDEPKCVNPWITYLAVAVNDAVAASERQKLLDLVPRLSNTVDDTAVTGALWDFFGLNREPDENVTRFAELIKSVMINAVMACLFDADRIALLVKVLDLYDAVMNRTEYAEYDLAVLKGVILDADSGSEYDAL